MPERKETNPADITRGAQRVVCGVRLVRERGTYTASGDRLRAFWSAADRDWLWVPPVGKESASRFPLPPLTGRRRSTMARPVSVRGSSRGTGGGRVCGHGQGSSVCSVLGAPRRG